VKVAELYKSPTAITREDKRQLPLGLQQDVILVAEKGKEDAENPVK